MNYEKLVPAFEWKSVLQDLPEDQTYLLFCFGVNVVEGSYDKGLWLSIAYGEAQPDFWAYLPEPPHHNDRKSLYSAATIDSLRQQLEAVTPKEDFCFCHDGCSLQIVSGGGAKEGYLGVVTLKVGDRYVDYVPKETP